MRIKENRATYKRYIKRPIQYCGSVACNKKLLRKNIYSLYIEFNLKNNLLHLSNNAFK